MARKIFLFHRLNCVILKLSVKKENDFGGINSVKSDRWKSSANDVAFELFELAACVRTILSLQLCS